MRNLITVITMFFMINVSAAEMPKYLKGATVTVTLKNGKTYTYKSEDMAVVPRENLQINSLKVLGFNILHTKLVNKEIIKNRRNRLYGFVGYNFDGSLDVRKDGDISSVKAGKDNIFGIGYMRKLNEKVNVGFQMDLNGTFGITLGTDF